VYTTIPNFFKICPEVSEIKKHAGGQTYTTSPLRVHFTRLKQRTVHVTGSRYLDLKDCSYDQDNNTWPWYMVWAKQTNKHRPEVSEHFQVT